MIDRLREAAAEAPNRDLLFEAAEKMEKLQRLLAEHHKWQLDADGLFMFYTDPKTNLIDCVDISREYPDSGMYERTAEALAEITLPKTEPSG